MSIRIKSLEEHLQKEGVHIMPAQGSSMRPALRDGDLVVLTPVLEASRLQIGDIVLYRRLDRTLVLHRIIKLHEDTLVLNGDNCTYFEYPQMNQIVGILKSYQRNGRDYSPYSFKNKFYQFIWYRPWPIRFLVLKIFRKFKKVVINNGN